MPKTPEHQARIDAGRRLHYQRRREQWDAMTREEKWAEVKAAFFAKLQPRGDDECWPWNRFCEERNTYGTMRHRGYGDYAHRISYQVAHGLLEVDQVVRHSCDWKPCVNPAHLLSGTQGDNIQDTYDRGRPGANRKITDSQVRELDARYRAGGVSMTALAREYSVSVPTVSEIISGKKRRRAFTVA